MNNKLLFWLIFGSALFGVVVVNEYLDEKKRREDLIEKYRFRQKIKEAKRKQIKKEEK